MARLRLALTISGAVSLGAYEGGVIAGLLNALRPLCGGDSPSVRLDAVGGASAGSMTGLLAARALTAGIDPVYVMRQAWVVQDSLQSMLHGRQDAPLSSDALRAMAAGIIDPGPEHRVGERQAHDIALVMVLADLRGLEYRIEDRTAAAQESVEATTYVDLVRLLVTGAWGLDDFVTPVGSSPVDVALASGANALGFPPKLLDRSPDRAAYQAQGLTLPESGHLWYTDGGTLDNEPLGHTLDLVADLDRDLGPDERRLHVLIHPHPSAPPAGNGWADPADEPTWVQTLARTDHIQRTQSLYDDLRAMAKTNTRIHWAEVLADQVGPALAALPAEHRQALAGALRASVEAIDAERSMLPAHRSDGRDGLSDDDPVGLLRAAVDRVAGLSGKAEIAIEVISPLVLPEARDTPVEQMLAGEVLMHFGGFFDEDLRSSDFDLGYESVLAWLESGALSRHGLDEAAAGKALSAAQAAYTPRPLWKKWGSTTVGDIARRHPFTMAALFGQLARVAGRDAVSHFRKSTS